MGSLVSSLSTATGATGATSIGTVGAIAADALTVKGMRPEITWPSTPTNRQRAVIDPSKSGGMAKTMMLSVTPCLGAASAVRTPVPLITSPVADARGTDLSKPTVHSAGEAAKTSPLAGELVSWLLWADTDWAPSVLIPITAATNTRGRARRRGMVKKGLPHDAVR